MWRILGFKLPSGDNIIRQWYRSEPQDVQAKFDTTLEFLVQRRRYEWGLPAANPRFKLLHPPFDGFGEIRFKVRNVHYRPIGFFSNGEEFTILEFAIEKGGRLPKGLQTKLQSRRNLVLGDKRRYTDEWRIVD